MIVERSNEGIQNVENCANVLEFTGNWFVDAGILGFVNLMEEVYGEAWIKEWKENHDDSEDVDFLKVLQEKLKREPEKVYYGYFPMAYVFYNNKVRDKENIVSPQHYKLGGVNKDDIFKESWSWVENNYIELKTIRNKKVKRINLSSSKEFNYFQNFLFFQPSWDAEQQKNAFAEVLGLKRTDNKILQKLDKTINKFLPSSEEFSNTLYGDSFVSGRNVNHIFILCFPFSFVKDTGRRFFYSNDLIFTYKVNKKLKTYVDSIENSKSIWQITWRSIVDTLIELESIWNVEEMYIVKYNLGKNQAIFDVEYIGISKLQANIILDDVIRNYLNISIPIRKEKNQLKSIWLLEEFIKNNSLYPLILGHTNLAIDEKTNLRKSSAIYSLSVEYGKNTIFDNTNQNVCDECVFSDFFEKQKELKEIPVRIKDMASDMFKILSVSHRIFYEDIQSNKNFVIDLFIPIKKSNRKEFVNRLLKNLIGKDKNDSSKVVSYIFKHILNNDNWEYWALPIVMGLIGGGKNE